MGTLMGLQINGINVGLTSSSIVEQKHPAGCMQTIIKFNTSDEKIHGIAQTGKPVRVEYVAPTNVPNMGKKKKGKFNITFTGRTYKLEEIV